VSWFDCQGNKLNSVKFSLVNQRSATRKKIGVEKDKVGKISLKLNKLKSFEIEKHRKRSVSEYSRKDNNVYFQIKQMSYLIKIPFQTECSSYSRDKNE
jgi:hypothetical protein